MITTINLVILHRYRYSKNFFPVMRMFNTYSLRKVQIYNTALLPIITGGCTFSFLSNHQ